MRGLTPTLSVCVCACTRAREYVYVCAHECTHTRIDTQHGIDTGIETGTGIDNGTGTATGTVIDPGIDTSIGIDNGTGTGAGTDAFTSIIVQTDTATEIARDCERLREITKADRQAGRQTHLGEPPPRH